jgi:hypothetical protein
MNRESKPHKPFAQIEQETIRGPFVKGATEAPIPNHFDPESTRKGENYVDEMRDLEQQHREAGELQ